MSPVLDLDTRQRAMLAEMGVQVWLSPRHTPAPVADAVSPAMPPAPGAAQAPGARAAPVRAERASIPPRPALAAAFAPGPAVQAATPEALAPERATPMALDTLDWPALAQTAATCRACGLCAGRQASTLAVPAVQGQKDWLVVGDPPDEDESRAGQPFVQAAGQLLDNMLKAVGAQRDGLGAQGAHVSHVLKCRPLPGQVPGAAELAQCAHYLAREIALVQPKVILALGRVAIQGLLGAQPALASQPLGHLRGTVYDYHGIPLVVSYHPRALLRSPADKAKAWADLCLALQVRSLQSDRVVEGDAPPPS